MSTIQTQINLVHLQAGLAVPAVTQRTTVGSQFASNAIEVTTTAETIPLGDVTTPKQVMIKFISGDPVQIGLDGTTYPFRLSAADEAGLLPLDVEGLVEVSQVEVLNDVAGSLNDKFFTVHDRNGEVKVVISTDGITSVTSSGRVVVATITSGATGESVGAAVVAAFASDPEIFASISGFIVTLRDKATGTRTNVAAGDSGFSVNTFHQGAPSPTIHLKSLGTSQIVVAVAPY